MRPSRSEYRTIEVRVVFSFEGKGPFGRFGVLSTTTRAGTKFKSSPPGPSLGGTPFVYLSTSCPWFKITVGAGFGPSWCEVQMNRTLTVSPRGFYDFLAPRGPRVLSVQSLGRREGKTSSSRRRRGISFPWST